LKQCRLVDFGASPREEQRLDDAQVEILAFGHAACEPLEPGVLVQLLVDRIQMVFAGYQEV